VTGLILRCVTGRLYVFAFKGHWLMPQAFSLLNTKNQIKLKSRNLTGQ